MKTARIKYNEWKSEMRRRFGERDKFEFVCPICKHPQTVKQCKEAGAAEGEIGFSCIGRHIEGSRRAFGDKKNKKKTGPCDYAGGGLFALNPVTVVFEDGSGIDVFDVSIEPFCDDPRFAVSSEKNKIELNPVTVVPSDGQLGTTFDVSIEPIFEANEKKGEE